MRKAVFVALAVLICVLAGIGLWFLIRDAGIPLDGLISPSGAPPVDSLKGMVERIEGKIASDNSYTSKYEDFWRKAEEGDTSAVRAQVYVEHMVHGRLINIDRTIEDVGKICYSGEFQIIHMLSSAIALLRYVLFVLVALGVMLLVFLVVFVLRAVVLG